MIKLRLIVIYIFIFWLFAYGFKTLSYLFNFDLAELIRHSGLPRAELEKKNSVPTAAFRHLGLITGLAYLLGCFLAFTIMLFAGRRKPKFYWLHSTVALLCFIVLNLCDLTGWNSLKTIFLAPGQLVNGIWFYIINGAIMIIIGAVLLTIAKSINSKPRRAVQVGPAVS
jgi:hypothetical protein